VVVFLNADDPLGTDEGCFIVTVELEDVCGDDCRAK
jgi:hypothetical protein